MIILVGYKRSDTPGETVSIFFAGSHNQFTYCKTKTLLEFTCLRKNNTSTTTEIESVKYMSINL